MKARAFALLSAALFVALLSESAAWAADPVHGRELVKKANCAACHGADMKTPIAADYPKLAGQHQDYLLHALIAYQTPDNPNVGRSNAIMQGQINANPAILGPDNRPRPFTRQELQDIAAYLSALPGDLLTKR